MKQAADRPSDNRAAADQEVQKRSAGLVGGSILNVDSYYVLHLNPTLTCKYSTLDERMHVVELNLSSEECFRKKMKNLRPKMIYNLKVSIDEGN